MVARRNRGGPSGAERLSGGDRAAACRRPSRRGYRHTLRAIGTARLCWRRRLRLAADDPEALQLSARSAARQNRDQQAIAIYSRLELRLMTAEDYFLLGRSLSRTGQDDLAVKALERSRDADPNRLEMLDELAQVYLRKQRPAAAAAIARQLIQERGWEARASLTLGSARPELRDPVGAASALRRAFELDPEGKTAGGRTTWPFRMLLARSLLQTGQPAERGDFSSRSPLRDRRRNPPGS